MAGTTSELNKLIPKMPHAVKSVRCPKNDVLCIAYARVGHGKSAVTVTKTVTVVVIAPLQSFWNLPAALYSETGWHKFKAWTTPKEIFQLSEVETLLKQGKGEKAWLLEAQDQFWV